MIREIKTGADYSVFSREMTNGLGEIIFYHEAGTFGLTPASNILIQAIFTKQRLFHGTGIDWGCGIVCLSIVAARMVAVKKIYGLDIAQPNIDAAIVNAMNNGVQDKVRFKHADSYQPYDQRIAGISLLTG
jgi:ribosomal protein L11 methylase PrmA